jgi:hypothetical protein
MPEAVHGVPMTTKNSFNEQIARIAVPQFQRMLSVPIVVTT